MSTDKLCIYTIGHSNLKMDMFTQLLKTKEITVLVDIRSVPYSRYYPQFNQGFLAEELTKAGIHYHFMGDVLGGRISDATCYINRELPDRKVNIAELIDYQELISRIWFKEGIEQLIKLAATNRVAIMCSEEDPARCHRNLLVARRLSEMNIDVIHIRKSGKLDPIITEQMYSQMKLFNL